MITLSGLDCTSKSITCISSNLTDHIILLFVTDTERWTNYDYHNSTAVGNVAITDFEIAYVVYCSCFFKVLLFRVYRTFPPICETDRKGLFDGQKGWIIAQTIVHLNNTKWKQLLLRNFNKKPCYCNNIQSFFWCFQ